jgi:hypothetical protein
LTAIVVVAAILTIARSLSAQSYTIGGVNAAQTVYTAGQYFTPSLQGPGGTGTGPSGGTVTLDWIDVLFDTSIGYQPGGLAIFGAGSETNIQCSTTAVGGAFVPAADAILGSTFSTEGATYVWVRYDFSEFGLPLSTTQQYIFAVVDDAGDAFDGANPAPFVGYLDSVSYSYGDSAADGAVDGNPGCPSNYSVSFNAQFTPLIVPEPCSLSLLAAGAVGLFVWRRRRI